MTTVCQIPLVKETNPTIDDKAVALSKALKEGRVEQEVEKFLQAFLAEGSRSVEKYYSCYNGLKGSAEVELVEWMIEGHTVVATVRSTVEGTTSDISFAFDFEDDEICMEGGRNFRAFTPIDGCSLIAGNLVHSFLKLHAASRF